MRSTPLIRTTLLGLAAAWAPACTSTAAPRRAALETPASGPGALPDASGTSRGVPVSVWGGTGFTTNPGTFLIASGADWHVDPRWSIGPHLQLGLADRRTFFAAIANVKRFFTIPGRRWQGLRPYAQVGIGVAYVEKERSGSDRSETGLALNAGGGLRYRLTDDLTIGTAVGFHALPTELADERAVYTWELVQLIFGF